MKIINLGTGHGDPTKKRYQSSTLLEIQKKFYLIDCGEPANTLLIRNDLCASMLSGIFITHMHDDHVGELPLLISQSGKYRHQYPTLKLRIFLPEKTATAPLLDWCRVLHITNVQEHGCQIESYSSGLFFDDGTLRFRAFPNNHLGSHGSSFSFLMEAEGKSVFFSGDLSAEFSDFPLAAFSVSEPVDLTFCELTHYPLAKAENILSHLNTKQLYFTHIGDWYELPEGVAQREAFMRKLPYSSAVAFDGMITEL